MQLEKEPRAAEGPLLAAEDVGRQALADLRRLLGVLRAGDAVVGGIGAEPHAPQPGLSALGALVVHTTAAGLRVALRVDGEPVRLPAMLDLTAYRIVQEALTNALKHSGGTEVSVRLGYGPSSLTIDVRDDGSGPPSTDDGGTGHGLIGIRERAAVFGGTATTGPTVAGGWQVRVHLPLATPASGGQHVAALPTS
jgi:signal transduction histidine kinase